VTNGKPGRPPRYPAITEDIIQRIERGDFAKRPFLTMRQAVREYSASSRTIDQVWEALKSKGYIEVVYGQGTYVKKRSS